MMWKVVSSQSSHFGLITLVLAFVCFVTTLPTSSYSMSLGTPTDSVDLSQLQSLVREALRYMQKTNKEEPTRITGQVNLRYPRSEFDQLKLYHLQELDRKYGAKARPRFGKRTEVTQDNFIPMYGDEEMKDSTIGGIRDGPPPASPPLVFIP